MRRTSKRRIRREDANKIAQAFKFYTPSAPSPKALFPPTTPDELVMPLQRIDEHILLPREFRSILPDALRSDHIPPTRGIINDVSLMCGVDAPTVERVINSFGQAIRSRVCSGSGAYVPYVGTIVAKPIYQKELSNDKARPGTVTISFVRRMWPIFAPATELVKELVVRYGIRHIPAWDEYLPIRRTNVQERQRSDREARSKKIAQTLKNIIDKYFPGDKS